jgi:hypothetical protein
MILPSDPIRSDRARYRIHRLGCLSLNDLRPCSLLKAKNRSNKTINSFTKSFWHNNR